MKNKKGRKNKNRKAITQLYLDEKWSTTRIAKKFGCAAHTISKWLHQWKVPVRTPGEALKKSVDTEQVAKWYSNGLSPNQIGAQLGCSRSVVLKSLRADGIPIRPNGYHARKHLDDQLLIQLYREGWSSPKIAKKMGTTCTTILSHLREHNVEIKPHGVNNRRPLDEEEMVRLYSSGMSAYAIASLFGESPNTISLRLRKLNIPIREYEGNKKKDLDDAKIVRMYESGQSCNQLAQVFHCSHSVILERLHAAGVEVRDGTLDLDEDKILRMYTKQGIQAQEIADLLGCSHNAVRKRLRKLGVEIRPASKFGSIRAFKYHKCQVKLGSGWEAGVYSHLWHKFGDGGFFFQGEFGPRSHLTTPKFSLRRPEGLPVAYTTNKSTYDWHPDFMIPGFGIIEVKGGWMVSQRWNQCVVPCIMASVDLLKCPVYVLKQDPHKACNWKQLRKMLERVV